MEQYLNNFKNCLQKEIPYCVSACPFPLDVIEFIEKMKRGGFKGAFKTYRNAVGFPRIGAALCHEPCKGVCPGKEQGGAIELLMLEKACIDHAGDRSPTDYNLPGKKKKVAVIGAGISGLACALRLCMKKYEVEIFEASDRMGGYLWELLDPELFLADIKEQFLHEKYVIHYNRIIEKPEDLAEYGFDAVYAATGDGGTEFGLLDAAGEQGEERYCARYGKAGWFAGGGLIGEDPVYALANGLYMGTVIDNYLKTGKLLNPANTRKTCIQTDLAKMRFEPAVPPANGRGYDEREAKAEAARCLECQCDFCRTYCDLTEFYQKWPLRIRDEIMATTLPGSADVKATPAKRLLSTCSQCGLCKEVCPEEIDLGGLILEGRKSMHRQKKAPWVFHDFWLRDMEFANSDAAAVVMAPMTGDRATDRPVRCEYAFFPGCQLGAGGPLLVEKAYEYLRSKRPDTGLILRCCGAPAEWSGDEEKFKGETETIRSIWGELGKPTLIMACPTCEKNFKTYLPELTVTSLYEIMADWGLPASQAAAGPEGLSGKVWSVFDACAARHEEGMKAAVRQLAQAAGCSLEPLPGHESVEQCCSFGGQPGIANPEYAEYVVQKRISESANPYITFCINCRDAFSDAGKEAAHILDLLFGEGASPRRFVTISQRRENRVSLKKRLLTEHWNSLKDRPLTEHRTSASEMETKENEERAGRARRILISEELAAKLHREWILEEEVREVLEFCERSSRRVFHPEKGTYSGYSQVGLMTYWIEYRRIEAGGETERTDETALSTITYELVNAYAHRMKVELEPVWNGRKTVHFS